MHYDLCYHDRAIDSSKYSEKAKKRLEKINTYHDLIFEGCSKKAALKAIRVSRATMYRWKKRYEESGLSGLEVGDRTPNDFRKPTWSNSLIQQILKIRRENPVWGKDKIAAIMRRDNGTAVSTSMVGRILSVLIKKGQIKPARFYYGHIRWRKKRTFSNHAERWEYGMKPNHPGELIQVDHATRKLVDGTIVKSFKAVDQVTKWSEEQAYGSATALIAKDFLKHMKLKFPFKIQSIMVDGGSEFMANFEEACKKSNIALYVLPPKRPQFNGCVEKGNSTTKYEFYNFYDGPSSLPILRTKLQRFIHRYNTYRPHQSLQYLTPLEYWEQLEYFESHMY